MLPVSFIPANLIGFAIAKYVSGAESGVPGRTKSLRFNIKSYTVHLHHWFLCLVMIGVLAYQGIYNSIVFGLLSGGSLQGLTYRDFYKLIYKKKTNNKIFSPKEPIGRI